MLWVALLLGAGLVIAGKTSVMSYARTAVASVRHEAKNQIPTRFEIERARQEIAHLDGDVSNMIRPIAEYMAAINRVKKDVQTSQAKLEEQRAILLTMTRDLESKPTSVVYGGEEYSAERVRAKMQRDFESYRRMEANLKSQQKLLEAKETSLKATQDQLTKVLTKKREFELRLAQLEADEETLQIARIGSNIHLDDSRTTQIESALQDIEHRHEVLRAEAELVNGQFANDVIPVTPGQRTTFDARAIHDYLEKGTHTASTK